ncbi:MAG: AMP-binding protein [Chloroflexi bacterium]|nr:AMP-binding protein [Chloroflexota bacterium]
MATPPETLPELLAAGDAAAPAIASVGREPLSYAALRSEVGRLACQLRAAGVERADSVAIVLPNGPEMAIAFLAVAAAAAAAPLNPAYREDEFRFYTDDLRAAALITREGDGSPATRAIGEGTRHLTLAGDPGSLTLRSAAGELARADAGAPSVDDVALVLHTSGTTSRPKMVPLTHRNLVTSAGNIARSLRLEPGDRVLNVMPLFHIHGLVGALLASLHAGASVAASPGFDAFRFFDWVTELRPTWYTAVPTMHQLILSRAGSRADAITANPLRFLRSSSASLPPSVMADLESTFRAPVIEAYGMTEASHQMACNPLPPGARKPGSVGLGTGIEVAIMDEEGALQPQGTTGEVVIRGASVTSGYVNNPEANRTAFTEGWFRTGDQGYQDPDGYLYLTGRLKEIINRGGEKISPREVDEVLLQHPAVDQAVAFAIPHRMLGEDIAAAVVLKAGATASDRDLKSHAAQHLADFKVPSKVVFVDEIPKGPTGKLQRIGLAKLLGLER